MQDLVRFSVPWPKTLAVNSMPPAWQKITDLNLYKPKQPYFAVLTGRMNNILVIDLDTDKTNKNAQTTENGTHHNY